MLPVNDTAVLLTPKGVAVSYRIAGFGARVFAAIVDLLCAIIIWYVISAAMSVLVMILPILAWLMPALMVLQVASIFLYYAVLEAFWGGSTLGKKALGIRTIMSDGTPVTLSAAVFRNLLRPADFVPVFFLGGLLCMFLTPKSQRIGDLAANTIVVRIPQLSTTFSPAPHRYGIHRLEDRIGHLRGMTVEDYVVLKRLCDRFPYLTLEAQQQLLNEIWLPRAKKLKIASDPEIHPIYFIEAVVMKFGRLKQLL